MAPSARRFALLAASVLVVSGHSALAAGPPPSDRSGLSSSASGIVTFSDRQALLAGVPALRAMGLRAQAMEALPMALVSGTASALEMTSSTGGRFWPDEQLELASKESVAAVGADVLHRRGFTGKGVTIAVIDSGIDATHPALSDHVTHNFEVLGLRSAEEVSPAPLPADPPVTVVDRGPKSNTDVGGGHGTIVAGVAAGDGTGDEAFLGAAPDATVIGYRVGTVSLRMLVAAMDHVLAHRELGVDIVNLSLGSRFTVFDPQAPAHVATRALHDAGILVVTVVGNEGAKSRAMTMSAFAAAPWVIAAGASTTDGGRADLSSNGLPLDGSVAGDLVDGHVRSTGDRLGIYRPSLLAPGLDLQAPCSVTGAFSYLGCNPGSRRASGVAGTSFAAPHVAGISALLLQAVGGLSPDQVKHVLEATAVPATRPRPAWQDGYGVVSAPRALDLIMSKNRDARLVKEHRLATSRLLTKRPWRVMTSDLWSVRPPVVAADGVTAATVLPLQVPRGIDAVTVSLAAYDYTNASKWHVVVRDADGAEVMRTDTVRGAKQFDLVGTAHRDLRTSPVAYGRWTLTVETDAAVQDEPFKDSFLMSVHAALLRAKH